MTECCGWCGRESSAQVPEAGKLLVSLPLCFSVSSSLLHPSPLGDSLCLPVWLSGCLSVWLAGCLAACLSACLPACLSERRGAGELTVSSEQWEYLGFPNVTNDTWADYDLQYINPSAVRWHSRTHTVVRTSLCVPGDVVCVDVWRRMCVAVYVCRLSLRAVCALLCVPNGVAGLEAVCHCRLGRDDQSHQETEPNGRGGRHIPHHGGAFATAAQPQPQIAISFVIDHQLMHTLLHN